MISNTKKGIQNISLENFKSRWALTSGRKETYCGDINANSFFGESIITFLANAESDVRIGTLIEYIKEKFKNNVLQQPQGHPILDSNHDCGEFVFRIKERKKLFEAELKGYNKFKRLVDNYIKSRNSDEIENFEDKTNKIGYILLRDHDKIISSTVYYLYLYNNITQTKTLAYLKEKHKYIFNRNTVLIIPNEKEQTHPERRLSNISKLFAPRNSFYLDDFINEISKKYLKREDDESDEKYLNINNFILPDFKTNDKNQKIDAERWLQKTDNPILVIKGAAGIGKTTYAKYISDLFQKKNIQTRKISTVLFIDSNEIQDELIYSKNLGKKIDLYSFYKAATINDLSFDDELFSINLDAGKILLIIDGLDEIISKNHSFDIDYFFKSISSSNAGLGNSKIIITTRSYFWDKSNIVDDIIYDIELLPFNLEKAKSFFEKSFVNQENKVKKALNISEDFKFTSEENSYNYHPFVLDIIKEIVESNDQILFSDTTFISKILNNEIKIDYIIGRICEREVKRVQQIEIDNQIKLFIYLAINENGKFQENNIKSHLKEILNINDISSNIVESIKSHPFLIFSNTSHTLSFKYDFFENYFISLSISKLIDLNEDSLIDYNTIKILSQKFYHGSDTIKNITKRTTTWNDSNLLKINDLIGKIKLFKTEDTNLLKRAISGIFNLALSINFKFKTNNRGQNTQLVKDIFLNQNNQIENLVLLNLNSIEEKIRFDFSNLTFENCIFENYNQFWDCNLNESTYFHKCSLKNIGELRKEVSIRRENFIDCDDDNTLYSSFRLNKTIDEFKTTKIVNFLEDFFKIFYKKGRFKRISDHLVRESHNFSRINQIGIKIDVLYEILVQNEYLIIKIDKSHGDLKIGINPNKDEVVLKFISEGKQTESLLKIIKAISEKL